MSTANKILMGASGAGGPVGPSDDEFNRVSFLSHFEGSNDGVNNQFTDGSASNHTITANGNVTQGSFGPFARPDGEWGVSFDGDGDILKTPSLTIGTGTITYECWLNFNTVAGNTTIVCFNDSDSARVSLYNSDGDLKIYSSANGGRTVKSSAFTTPNSWIKLLLVRASNTATVYLDGTSVGTGTMPENLTGVLAIGAYNGGEIFNGIISNVRLSDNARQSGNYTVETAPLASDSNTDLLTCQSNRFVDNSSNGHTITPTGNPAVTAFGPFLTNAVYDPAVNGASMQGFATTAGDSVQIAQTTDTDLTGDFTVECWVYFNDLDNSHGLIAKWANGTFGWLLSLIVSSGFQFQIRDDGSNPVAVLSGAVATTGQWYHVAACRTGTTVSMFVNGVRAATVTTANNGTISSITSIGNYYSSADNRYLEGYLCDARIINGTAAYDGATYTIPTAPLTAVTNTKLLLNMADGQAIDSAAQNNLTLVGTAKTSTAQKKFGNSSMVFTTGSAALAPKDFLAFGTGNFTVEFFVRFDNPSSLEYLLDGRPYTVNGPYFSLYSSAGVLKYQVSNSVKITGSSALNANTFYHVAVCRSGTDTKMFVDGTQIGSTYSDSNDYLTSDLNQIGRYVYNSNYDFKGYMDEIRISRMARYTSNFTAPTAPFPDKGQ